MLTPYNAEQVRAQFPILSSRVHNKPLVYLDNAATTQKPQVVIDRLVRYYTQENANIHRGVHHLSETASRAHDEARQTIQKFLNARSEREIIFTRGCTEGINLVAATWGRQNIHAGDEIILSAMEHHSNIVPWQMLCDSVGASLKVIPMNEAGELDQNAYRNLFSERTKLVTLIHLSNALGTINPAREMIELAHQHNVPVLLDGAQSIAHFGVDVQALNCDFFTFSGHKIYGPTGIGVLYAKEALLQAMPPYQGGGDMISSVTWQGSTWNQLPYKFEAGTPHIEGAIGLGTAIAWLQNLGIQAVARHEQHLLKLSTELIQEVPGVRLIGTAQHKASVLAFVVENQHPNDIGVLLDSQGIAVRTGHHCAQPVIDRYQIPATVRASFAAYNTEEDVHAFINALHKTVKMLS